MRQRALFALTPALLLAALLLPAPASSQVKLIPQVGLYAPVSDVGAVEGVDGAVDIGKKESTLAYGGALELGDHESATALRIGGLFASESDVPVGGVGCEGCGDVRSTVLVATAALLLRPLDLVVVRPYALAGVGAKRYDFSSETGLDDLDDGQTKLSGQLGLGTEINLGSLRAVVELSHYMSSIEIEDESGDLQHDFFFTVGLVLGG